MASPAEGVKDLLVAASVGTFGATTGWAIMVGTVQEDPNTMISIFDSPGEPSNPKYLLDFPYFQILIRGEPGGYEAAHQKAIDCRDVLLGMDPAVVNSDNWDIITQVGTVSFLKQDESSRPVFTSNYRIILEPAASGLTNRVSL